MKQDQNLPLIPSEHADDLHGLQWVDDSDRVLFMAGNQLMVLPEFIKTFQAKNPVNFIGSFEAKEIYQKYGFVPAGNRPKTENDTEEY